MTIIRCKFFFSPKGNNIYAISPVEMINNFIIPQKTFPYLSMLIFKKLYQETNFQQGSVGSNLAMDMEKVFLRACIPLTLYPAYFIHVFSYLECSMKLSLR